MGKAFDLFCLDRFRPAATNHTERPPSNPRGNNTGDSILPLHRSKVGSTINTGALSEKKGRGLASRFTATKDRTRKTGDSHASRGCDAERAEGAVHNDAEDSIAQVAPPPAPPLVKSEDAGAGDTAVESSDGGIKNIKLINRLTAGLKRFGKHTRNAIFHSWLNVLLVFVPIGIVANITHLPPAFIFAANAVAIVPLAGLLSHATESVARRLGDTLGALLNVSFGNAVELIIFIIALVKNEVQIVQASLLGSILANLLLILGMAFLLGGLRYREQLYNSTVTQMSACLLSLSVMSLLLPTAFYASFNASSSAVAAVAVLRVSRGTSVILLVVYVLYLIFQLKTHAYMYESTPQEIIDEESHPGLLADAFNSSSSSDTSSSSSDNDSDTSGSIMTTGKRIRNKMFKRRRRKSSASASNATQSSVFMSAVSSPSIPDHQASDYWDPQITGHQISRHKYTLGGGTSGDEADADIEEGAANTDPRVRDFVQHVEPTTEDAKSSDHRKRRGKRDKKHRKARRHRNEEAETKEKSEMAASTKKSEAILGAAEPRVGFAEDIEAGGHQNQVSGPNESPGKLQQSMRHLSSHVHYRPALPRMLSNTVFTTPAPALEPLRRPAPTPVALISTAGDGLRRTSSLPDRLNRQTSVRAPFTPAHGRTDPLPPFQHQRAQVRRSKSADQDNASETSDDDEPQMSRTAAIVLLVVSTALVAVCAEFMVSAIPEMIASSPVSQAFIGLIILPIVGNAAEHVTAVTVATKNKMDLAIGVAVGSSIQIALFVTPVVVLLGWILGTNMSLYFNLFETISLFVTAFVVNFLVLDGRSNYLEGSLLIAAYIIIAVGAFYYPSAEAQSAVGGGASNGG